jgi:hypothetical protein
MAPGKKIDNTAATVKTNALTAATAASVAATAATSSSPFGYAQAQADAIVTNVNKLVTDEANTRAVLSALIDELSARGVL